MQQSKPNPVNQGVALLEGIGKNTEGIFLESNEEEIIPAQAIDEVESEDILDDLELIQGLGEEIGIDDLIEDINILDELDIEST